MVFSISHTLKNRSPYLSVIYALSMAAKPYRSAVQIQIEEQKHDPPLYSEEIFMSQVIAVDRRVTNVLAANLHESGCLIRVNLLASIDNLHREEKQKTWHMIRNQATKYAL